jgi:hypothetical protein
MSGYETSCKILMSSRTRDEKVISLECQLRTRDGGYDLFLEVPINR